MVDAKTEDKGGGGFLNIKNHLTLLFWVLSVILTLIIATIIILYDTKAAQNFVYFINAVEIFFVIYIVSLIVKLKDHLNKFKAATKRIEDFYASRYVKPDENVKTKSQIELRFEKAKDHIDSKYQEEWKIGVIELDTILRDLLKEKFTGETVGELLDNAKEKGFDKLNEAWEAHKVRNNIVHEGVRYVLDESLAVRTLNNYKSVFRSLGLE